MTRTNSAGTIKLTNENFLRAIRDYGRKHNVSPYTVKNKTILRDLAIAEFSAREVVRARILAEVEAR